ncbi:zinc ribbon domain-containing protein [Sporosarcina sp. FSL W7-1283]|uniref:zinc ribbon domain-containing protein n=1 Tax=Sporosarcina sp. FSL W7-1283 TaxID=2921560 RepID=UPI004046C271
MRIKSLFYKKISCGNCQGNFKMKREGRHKKKVYVCSTYDNSKKCQRNAISEAKLVELVNNRFRRELTEDEIREVVSEIVIYNKLHFDIILSEGSPISFHENGIVF